MTKTKEYYIAKAQRKLTEDLRIRPDPPLIHALHAVLNAYSYYSFWQRYCCCLCLCCFKPQHADSFTELTQVGPPSLFPRGQSKPDLLIKALNSYWFDTFSRDANANKTLLLGMPVAHLMEAIGEILTWPSYAGQCHYQINRGSGALLFAEMPIVVGRVLSSDRNGPPSYDQISHCSYDQT